MLPEGWKNTTIGAEFDIQLGKMLNKEAKAKFPQFKYLTNVNVRWGGFDLTELNEMYFSEADQKKFALRKGDLLVCEGGEIGRCAIWKEELKNCFYQKALHRIRAKADASIEFLKSFLEYNVLNNKLVNLVGRTSIAHLPKEKLETIPLTLPPLSEQKKIAEILSTWDEAISVVDKQLENCRLQKKALMQQLLTGKKRLPGFNGEWQEKKISEIASVNPENLANSTRNNYRFSYISLDDVTEGNLTGFTQQTFASSPSRARRIIQQGDILVAMVRPNLKSHLLIRNKVEDFICSTGFCVIRPREGVLSQYIYHQFFGDIVNAQIEALITGSNYPAINSYDVENIMIPLPSDIQEQKAIVNVLDGYESSLKRLAAKRNLLVLEKKSLMQQLLTGKKRVAVEE